MATGNSNAGNHYPGPIIIRGGLGVLGNVLGGINVNIEQAHFVLDTSVEFTPTTTLDLGPALLLINGSNLYRCLSVCNNRPEPSSAATSAKRAEFNSFCKCCTYRYRIIIQQYINGRWISKIPALDPRALSFATARRYRTTISAPVRTPQFTYYAERAMKCFEMCIRNWELQTSLYHEAGDRTQPNWVEFRHSWRDVMAWTRIDSKKAVLAISRSLYSFEQIAKKAFERPQLELFASVMSMLLDPRVHVQSPTTLVLCATEVMLVACEQNLGNYHPLTDLIRLVIHSVKSRSRFWQPIAHGYALEIISRCPNSTHILKGSEEFLPSLTEVSSYIACGWGDNEGAERQVLKTLASSTNPQNGTSYLENCARYHYAHVLLNRGEDDRAILLFDQVRQTSTYDLQARNDYIRKIAVQHLAYNYVRRGSVGEALAVYEDFLGDFADFRSKGAIAAKDFADIVTELEIAGYSVQSRKLRHRFPECAKYLPEKNDVKVHCCILGMFK